MHVKVLHLSFGLCAGVCVLLQAQRLSWHPSIALWCGNNEIDLSYEWSNSTVLRSNRNMFVVDYQAVFIDTVRKNIKQVRLTLYKMCPVLVRCFQPGFKLYRSVCTQAVWHRTSQGTRRTCVMKLALLLMVGLCR